MVFCDLRETEKSRNREDGRSSTRLAIVQKKRRQMSSLSHFVDLEGNGSVYSLCHYSYDNETGGGGGLEAARGILLHSHPSTQGQGLKRKKEKRTIRLPEEFPRNSFTVEYKELIKFSILMIVLFM